MQKHMMLSVALTVGIIIGAAGTAILRTGVTLPASLWDNHCASAYDLINPWLRCEPEQNLQHKKEFSDYKLGLQLHIDAMLSSGRAHHVSVYLRDLQFGPWMGIEEADEYSAASLLKSAVLLAVLKHAEANPGTLEQRVEVTPEVMSDFAQNFLPERTVKPGSIYTVNELLEYMIVYSDNNATNALHYYLDTVGNGEQLFLISMEELGILGRHRLNDDSLTVKQAASLFRQLYNSSYLSKDMSQKALRLLMRSDFSSGIVAGVPSGVRVAHKFGERRTEDGLKQLHDCGIVYFPGGDYLLCIMTRGDTSMDLASVIADISADVYKEMMLRFQADS